MTDAASVRLEDGEADLEQVEAASDAVSGAAVNSPSHTPDYFITRDGQTFAGYHWIIDLWGAGRLDDPAFIEAALVTAARAGGATVLSSRFHHFQPNGGVTGVVVLAESHISIHTWPERAFAAIDVFMCGDARPRDTIRSIERAFRPREIETNEIRRGNVVA